MAGNFSCNTKPEYVRPVTPCPGGFVAPCYIALDGRIADLFGHSQCNPYLANCNFMGPVASTYYVFYPPTIRGTTLPAAPTRQSIDLTPPEKETNSDPCKTTACTVADWLGAASFVLGFTPFGWAALAGVGLGLTAAALYYGSGRSDIGNRQLASTVLGVGVGKLTGGATAVGGRMIMRAPAVAATPVWRTKAAGWVTSAVGDGPIGWSSGIPWCGSNPIGCDPDTPMPDTWLTAD